MYYIYHIPGVKIGCSMYPKRRVKVQGYTEFEIIEEYIDKNTAADREIELQIQYGYSSDLVKYNQTNYSEMGKIAGQLAVKTGHIHKIQKEAVKIASSLPRSQAQIDTFSKAQKIGSKVSALLPRSQAQMNSIIKAQKIGCIIGGKVMGKIMKEKLRVPIAVYRKCDDTFVGEYPSVMDCSYELQLSAPDIFHCLSGKQKSTKGYKFQKIKK
jgi:hypothetical protein